ncbi:PWWP domain-containing protein 2A, partial [Scomber scombrus]
VVQPIAAGSVRGGGAPLRSAAQRKKMAAVAAEPGAAAPTITTGAAEEEGGPEPGPVAPVGPVSPVVSVVPGKPEAPLQSDGTLSNVNPACKQPAAREQRGDRAPVLPELPELPGPDQLINNLPVLPGPDQLINNFPVSRSGPGVPGSSLQDPQPSAVFLLSPPVTVPVPEAGLSLDEPAEPTDRDRDYTELRPGPDPEGLQDSSPGEGGPGPGPVQNLNLGSEVRVCLDHVIDDALVVSFRLGEKVFSGVLMDVTRRFGPYGIPITVFPRRDRPSLQSDSIKQEEVTVSPPPPPPPSQSWTSKPPPLFQEGAPYPPPLLIRDTYNQALPQPPPRKIKRPKRRYRSEEPTSIMNAIKLRPRQVLCDKCKGVVASGGHREARRGPVDLRGEEASRRRRSADGPISSEVKRLRSDDKGSRGAASSGIRVTSSSHRVLRGVASSPATSSGRVRLKLNSKKVLTKGSTDRSKARQVLKKLARSSQPPSHRRPKDQNQNQNLDQSQDQSQNQDRTKAVTRAAALQNHNQKVHFTRRLQQLGGAAVGLNSALPPRMRLKPQSATSLKSC